MSFSFIVHKKCHALVRFSYFSFSIDNLSKLKTIKQLFKLNETNSEN